MKTEGRPFSQDPSESRTTGPVAPFASRPSAGARPAGRSKIKDGIKTFLWVLPLTALIWIYADREQIATSGEIQVTVRLRANSPDRVVTMLAPENRQVFMELRGPLSSIEAVRYSLADSGHSLDVTVPDDMPLPYKNPINIAEWLSQNPLLTKEAVTVARVRPSTVTVLIEKKVAVTVPIKVRPEDLAKIGSTPQFQIDKVVVEGPQSVLAGAAPEVYANMSKALEQSEGTYSGDVPLEVVGNPSASMSVRPATVKAVVTIKRSPARVLPQPIPVLVTLNGATLESEDFHFKFDKKVLADINVVGSPSAMEELDKRFKDDRLFPAAKVDLSPREVTDSLERDGVIVKKLAPDDFRMPKGITVTNTDLVVTVTVTRKSGL